MTVNIFSQTVTAVLLLSPVARLSWIFWEYNSAASFSLMWPKPLPLSQNANERLSTFGQKWGPCACLPRFLVNVRYMLSPVRLSSVCLSVTLVHPTQAVEIFGNISTALGTWKFHGDRPRETPPPGELNPRGVAKYSDFRHIDGYISETVQDMR